MKTTNNTILITGGSAGIGFAMAKLFSENNNRVIITGRNKERLDAATTKLKNTTAIVSDITKAEDVESLVIRLNKDFPELNVLINNAGNAFVYNLAEPGINAFHKAGEEMLTNYLSVIRLTEKLLPLFNQKEEAAIVNVSSIVAFAPNVKLTTYGASKAALHSYTQALRLTLEETKIKVFELMPPLVDTEFSTEIGGSNGIAPKVVADDLLNAFAKDEFEVHVGKTADIYKTYFPLSKQGFLAINGRG